ncbi:hypothetical protein D3C83_48300 [compost metagenome]
MVLELRALAGVGRRPAREVLDVVLPAIDHVHALDSRRAVRHRSAARQQHDKQKQFLHGHPKVGMLKPGAGVSWCGQRVVTTFVRV